jgi:hypothetical protein
MIRGGGLMLPVSLFLVTVITRIPFASRFLYHMDSVQFALALDNYNITVHQPHPPGYFLYVMLGRLVHLFIDAANDVYIFISILFSGLTVLAVFYLGKALFDLRGGFLAAVFALSSPNLWFHGEVALSYVVEAFLSTAVAYCCWKVYKGEERYIWISAVVLGIAGGIRQNTVVFLLPLWLYSLRRVPFVKIIASVGILAASCLLWFLPMIRMTGGWHAYTEALRELWVFNTGKVSVFQKGWSSFKIFSYYLLQFTLLGVGAGVFVLVPAAYSLIRRGRLRSLDSDKALFFTLWVLPSVFFYLLIFIHPTNPGYVLIFMPALFLLMAASVSYLSDWISGALKTRVLKRLTSILVVANVFFFVAGASPASYPIIRSHDRDLQALLRAVGSFDAARAAVFVGPYTFFGFRQIMYYLPEYLVYQVDVRVTPEGEMRKTFWGFHEKTHLVREISLPRKIDTFVVPLIADDADKGRKIRGVYLDKLANTHIYIASGPVSLLKRLYPGLKVAGR